VNDGALFGDVVVRHVGDLLGAGRGWVNAWRGSHGSPLREAFERGGILHVPTETLGPTAPRNERGKS